MVLILLSLRSSRRPSLHPSSNSHLVLIYLLLIHKIILLNVYHCGEIRGRDKW